MNEKEEAKAYSIPVNYKVGLTAFGSSFQYRNVIEAICLALAALMGTYKLLDGTSVSTQWKISLLLIAVGLALLIGVNGVNGDPISIFILHFLKTMFNKKKVMLYNPRVKYEALAQLNDSKDRVENEEQAMSLYQKWRSQLFRNTDQRVSKENIDLENVEFIEDLELSKPESKKKRRIRFNAKTRRIKGALGGQRE